MFIKFVDIDWFFYVIFTLVCSLRACHIWYARNPCLFVKFGENLTRPFFEILKSQNLKFSQDFKISKKWTR